MRTIFTAGHSTRAAEELLALLREAGVRTLADVRRYPSSRRHPQFDRAALEATLAHAGVDYLWLGAGLGGRRREILSAERSPNRAWTAPGFRHYADAMTTPGFQAALADLEAAARARPTAVLCAEHLWWRCHRRLLADLLLARGWRVVHLLEPGKSTEHRLTGWARLESGGVTYPGLL